MNNKFNIYKIIPAILWSGIIFFSCFLPGNQLPKEDWLDKIYFDKIVHFCLYLILFFWIIFGFTDSHLSPKKIKIIAISWCLVQGVWIEIMQGSSYIQHRSFDVFDIVANLLGVAVGWFVMIRKDKLF